MTTGKTLIAPAVFKRLVLDDVDSTNSEAMRQAKAGAGEGLWIVAKSQSAGRGRRGRQWSSFNGNLFASLLLRPATTPQTAANISFVAALAVHDVVCECLADCTDIHVKWPNDVLVGGAKISGILLESAVSADGAVEYLVVGIGINVATAPTDTPYPSTSLLDNQCLISTDEVMDRLEKSFANWYGIWCAQGFAPIRSMWLKRTNYLNSLINVRTAHESLNGVFTDIDENGALILDVDGDMRQIHAGDVFPVQDG